MLDWLEPGPAAVALLPVLGFLALLLLLDGYKLVRPRLLLGAMLAGLGAAAASYAASALLLGLGGLSLQAYSGHVAPFVEEAFKGLVLLLLARQHRVAFLVDAAIAGFAVGSGFALWENLSYLRLAQDAEVATWVTRGFGTAVMHGGTTAMLAVLGMSVLERHADAGRAAFVPGWLLASLLHAGFNRLAQWPQLATVATLLLVPLVLLAVLHISERQLASWVGEGFDQDVDLLAQMDGGDFAATHAGQYLHSLREHLPGPTMEAALQYLRLYTQLSLRAKGVLMAREMGLPEPALDAAARERLLQLLALERQLGASGRRVLRPLLRQRRQVLSQLNLVK